MSYWKYMCKPRNHGNLPLIFSLHANRIPYRVISQLHPEELSPSIGQLFYIHFFFWCCLNGTSLLHLHVYKWNHDTFLLWAEKLFSFFFFFSRLIPTSEIYRHCGSTACGYWSNKVYPMLRKQNRIDHRYQSVGRALDHQPNGCINCLASPHASRCSLNEFDHQWNS